ncbi:MAG: GNAT family protein [Candidatus Neomarinimicrobiota bacterium]
MQNPFLIGEKIYLRPLQSGDAEFICRGENDPVVRETLFLAFPIDPEKVQEKISLQTNTRETLIFMIVSKDADEAIGQIAFFRLDWVSRAAVFYIALLDPAHWSKGFGSEATHLMVDYAFETLNLNRIQLHVFADNVAAIKIYQKAGFVKEGILREAMFHHNRYCDFWVMGILKSDWLKFHSK